jgi:5-methylcytosine-specific restriction endonuclease McrBC regulatory subunit McrC
MDIQSPGEAQKEAWTLLRSFEMLFSSYYVSLLRNAI